MNWQDIKIGDIITYHVAGRWGLTIGQVLDKPCEGWLELTSDMNKNPGMYKLMYVHTSFVVEKVEIKELP